MFKNICLEILSRIEYIVIIIKYYIFGIDYIINYLRNPNPRITIKILKKLNAKIGKNVKIKRSIYFDNVYEDYNSKGDFSNFIIEDNCYIGDCNYFDLSNKIVIGPNSMVSARCTFVTHQDANRSSFLTKYYQRKSLPIVLEGDNWIGVDSTILSGITIKKGAVIGSKSLINRDVSLKEIVVGIPGRKIKTLK